MADTPEVSPITRTEDVENSPGGIVRRWLAELNIADRTERDWRTESEKLWKLYEGENKKANSFNIFWSNTETLLPAIYNSSPQPDVRRRFRDADPVGKAVSELLERSLAAEIDLYDFDAAAESFALDMLITGRGVLRVKYEPKFMAMPAQQAAAGDMQPEAAMDAPEPGETPQHEQNEDAAEKLAGESVECECVQWDDFRRGPGKRWEEVPWVGFRHQFTQEMAEDKFGPEIAGELKYAETRDSKELATDNQTREIFKTVEVWEIWDRDERRVLFIAPSYSKQPLLLADDPLHLVSFFPCPRPGYAIKNTRTLVPTPLYKLYEEQAKELDRVSARINKTINALKVRGAYSSNLPELGNMLESEDGSMTPVANVSEVASVGGLDKALWIMPLDDLQKALQGLYAAREQIKQTIYEITGISDVIRGSTVASETATAQSLKSQWGSLRLQRLQREVQRTIRDVMRLKAEVIAERFSPETLAQVTGLQFPTMAEKQQAQQMAMVAAQTGQQPPPQLQEVMQKPAWEELLQVLRSDGLRQYRVDVETDSTVAETINRDMQGLSEVTTAIGGVLGAVAQGLPMEVAKEVSLAIARHARLGSAVEDALENLEQPQAPDQGAQLEATKQQIVDLVKSHGSKLAQTEQAQAESAQQTQGVLQQVGQVGQQAAMTLQDVQQQTAMHGQALQQVGQQLAQLTELVMRPKAIQFTRDASGRIAGAQAAVQ